MARAEINRVIKDDRLPTLEDRADCPVTEAIIMETLRLIPTTPLGAPHTNKKQMEFEGYCLPTRSTVSMELCVLKHTKSYL